MRLFLKKTQTLIDSCISSILFNITRNKGESQEGKIGIKLQVLVYSFFVFLLLPVICNPSPAYAVVDPLSVPNNKFGIHILQTVPEESSPAASLVNSSGGDWGYVTVLAESKSRDHNKWQDFFNDLRRRHLIPLVRLATEPEGSFWKRPYEGEEQAWADFLDALNWPTKNRYIIVYNEPNHAKEWGNFVDAKSYAKILDKTVAALKNKNQDFFVLNAGFDASAPSQSPTYEDEENFIREMEQEIPGIFNKLDGWVSHSYPNPEFIGSPESKGRGTVKTYEWEMELLRELGVNKDLLIFITETGWKHAEGLNYDRRLLTEETVAEYFETAFKNIWNSNKIVAITPFLLNYQEEPFDHFSFKKLDQKFYVFFQTIQDLSKTSGKPAQEKKAELTKGEIYSSIVAGETYLISLTFKNTGQSIWSERGIVKLTATSEGQRLGMSNVEIPQNIKIEPGGEYTFKFNIKAPESGKFLVVLNLFEGEKQFDSPAVNFTTQVKSPVILKVIAALGWKTNFAGDYILKMKGINGENGQNVTLNSAGISPEIEAKYLLPDYSFEFSLEKPFYLKKTVQQKVYTGINNLNFGSLQPDLLSVILHPVKYWKLKPFSN